MEIFLIFIFPVSRIISGKLVSLYLLINGHFKVRENSYEVTLVLCFPLGQYIFSSLYFCIRIVPSFWALNTSILLSLWLWKECVLAEGSTSTYVMKFVLSHLKDFTQMFIRSHVQHHQIFSFSLVCYSNWHALILII